MIPIAKRYNHPAVYLFGSYARGEATADGDLDFLVDTTGTGLTSLLKLGELYCELEAAFQKTIDLITVSFSILQIRELSGGLSEQYRQATANRVQWEPIKAMRNLVAHNYGIMDQAIIWEIATADIPVLLKFCEEKLSEV